MTSFLETTRYCDVDVSMTQVCQRLAPFFSLKSRRYLYSDFVSVLQTVVQFFIFLILNLPHCPLIPQFTLGYMAVVIFPFWPYSSELDFAGNVLFQLGNVAMVAIFLIVIWMFLLAMGSAYSIYYHHRVRRFRKRIFDLQLKCFSVLEPQSGEMTKQERRQLYHKHNSARKMEGKSRVRKKHKNKSHKKEILDSQVGVGSAFSAIAALKDLAEKGSVYLDDDIINKIENLLLLWGSLREATTISQVIPIFSLYFKTLRNESVIAIAKHYLGEILDTPFDTQSGEFGLTEDETPPWLKMLKQAQENWTLVFNNPGVEKISNVLSLCLALGLCDAANLKFEYKGMKLFSIAAAPKHKTAFNLVDAVFDTVVYFAEGGYMCFRAGNLKPLLFGGRAEEEFGENYLKIMRCQDLAKSGNLEKVESLSENDYDALLQQTIEQGKQLRNCARGALERNILTRKIEMLNMWKVEFQQSRVQGGLRISPYSIGVFGATAVGKSTIANILMVTTLMFNGYAATDDRLITLNDADKFWSNYRSYMNGILFDDPGNTKPEFVERPPTFTKLQIVNNVKLYANMAEAEMKGKVSVEPKVYIETKNVKDLCAHVYSNEPASIARRDHVTLTCTVRPEFATDGMLDSAKVDQYFGGKIPLIPDLWYFKVERAYPIKSRVEGQPDNIGWKTLSWKGEKLDGISIKHLIHFLGAHSSGFFKDQKKLVENNSNLAKKLVICPCCKFPTPDVCQCSESPVEYLPRVSEDCARNHYCPECEAYHHDDDVMSDTPSEESGDTSVTDSITTDDSAFDVQMGKTAFFLKKKEHEFRKWFLPTRDYWMGKLDDFTLSQLVKHLDWLEESEWTCWTNYVPSDWFGKPLIKSLIYWSNEAKLQNAVRANVRYNIFCIVGALYLGITFFPLFLLCIPFNLIAIAGVVERQKQILYDDLLKRNDAMPEVFKTYRNKHVKWICGVSLAVAAMYALATIYKEFRVIPDPQGNLIPKTMKDVEVRDAEVNPWAGVQVSPMPCSEKAKTTSVEQLESMVKDNLCYMEMEVNGQMYNSNAFFLKSNVALIPNHVWIADDIKANFVRHDPKKIGGNFGCYLYQGWSVHIPDTDLSLVWVPNGGDWKDLSSYLPEFEFASVPARLNYKDATGAIKRSKLRMEPQDVTTIAGTYFGSKYTLEFPTFQGLCMAPLVTETKGPLIGGFHLGGRNGEHIGCSGLLTTKQFEKAFADLEKKRGLVLGKSSGTLKEKQYDIQFFQGPTVHPKSPVNFLPPGTNCKFYGSCTGRATYHSEVEESVISALVSDICGVPNKWGKPQFRTGYPFQKSLAFSTKPSIGIEGSLLQKASDDYLNQVAVLLDEFPEMKVDIRPLSEMENVCGRDGKRFLDKIPPNTSVGFPLSGLKERFLTFLDPKDYPGFQCPVQLDSMFWDTAYEMERRYLAGERAYPIFKACLKDEPTLKTKDKVRVFQGAPLAFQLLIRKYFLPVARFLSINPLVSECAVGINAQGPEWDQLADYVSRFGMNRILAGDYSKYDLRMPAQVMFAAFGILIAIAEKTGNYTADDLCIMRGIATDVCYPLMAYNGDLIQHYGSNPSGQNLTVYINSVVNSLLFRCAYYDICGERVEQLPFNQVCSLITYGDDAKSSVREGYEEFNHISVAKFLERHDMKFTMPDKTSEPVPYMTDADADLLKRKNVYNPVLGVTLGALDEDSIMKSLHANLRSKVLTKEQVSMQCIDGALREYFAHGPEKYEDARTKLTEVAKRAGIAHGCRELTKPYQAHIEKWIEKYRRGKQD